MPGTKYIIMGCDPTPLYWFFLPSTTAMWSAIGYRPVYVLSGKQELWEVGMMADAVETSRALGGEFHFVGSMEPRFADSTIAQVCRLFGGCIDGLDSDYLLTGDIDLWPLAPGWYFSQDMSNSIHLFHGDEYRHLGYPRYPMCHVGAARSEWKSLFPPRGSLASSIRIALAEEYGSEREAKAGWGWDEALLTARIRARPGFPDKVQVIDTRDWPGKSNRLDRGDWHDPLWEGWTDCHCLRPGDEHWTSLCPVFHRIVEERNPAREAVEKFVERYKAKMTPTTQ